MSILSTIVKCPDIQSDLYDHFVNTNTSAYLETPGFLRFLTSETNRNGVVQVGDVVSPGGGKTRTVQLRYEQRLPETFVTGGTSDLACAPTQELGDTIASYEIDPVADGEVASITIPYNSIIENCKENGEWFLSKLSQLINVMDRKVAQKMSDQAALLTGSFVDTENVTANVKTVSTQDSSGNNLQNLLEEVVYNSENNGYPGSTVAFGWGELKKYFTRVAASCCATSGTDLNTFMAQNPFTFVGDYRIEQASAFDKNHFLVTTPGALQIIRYNQFEGANMVEDDSFTTTTINSPATGLPYDLFISKTCTNGGISINVNLRTAIKLVNMPDDMFGTGDRMEGVNFVNEYEIVNA
jgi:hypothetical protein